MAARDVAECAPEGTMVTPATLISVEIPVLPIPATQGTQGNVSMASLITHVTAMLALEGKPAPRTCVPLASAITMAARASHIGTHQTTSVYAH